MLTSIKIRNFKRFDDVAIELGNPVVFIGPNNSGKTSALQALVLWELGVKRWLEKRGDKEVPSKRSGVTINRKDLLALPTPVADLLWRERHVRDVERIEGKPKTNNTFIDLIVEGVSNGSTWKCGLEFYYANPESFYCRPIRADEDHSKRSTIPEAAGEVQVALLPPMSGLAANEVRLDPGAINVRIGEGRTADVLRNLCYNLFCESPQKWNALCTHVKTLFGAIIDEPEYASARGEIVMQYSESGSSLDLSCSGRGLQQTMLLLAYLYTNSGAVLLLDEPDAHLEILRQSQIYQLLKEVAVENGNQIIAASHSEILLNEAAGQDVVIAFVGAPHRLNDRKAQVLKSLRDIGWDDYYRAEQTGWVMYLEGSTDLAILRAFAELLGHTNAIEALQSPFVRYVGIDVTSASNHYYGLKEAVPHLRAVAIFDRLERAVPSGLESIAVQWSKREIENYLCSRETLTSFASDPRDWGTAGPLFAGAENDARVSAMTSAIDEVDSALATLGKPSPWDSECKVSDDFLAPVFEKFYTKLGLPNLMRKKNYHALVKYVPPEQIDREIEDKLERIVAAARGPQSQL